MNNFDEKTVNLVNELIKDYPNFDIEDTVMILPKILQHYNTYENMSGAEKKNYIVNLLKHIVDKTDSPGDDTYWDPIIKMIPKVIDVLTEVDSRQLRLKPKKTLCSYLKLFWCKK